MVSNVHYIIQNKALIIELETKVKRILAFEQSQLRKKGKHYFRQNIFGILEELENEGVAIHKVSDVKKGKRNKEIKE